MAAAAAASDAPWQPRLPDVLVGRSAERPPEAVVVLVRSARTDGPPALPRTALDVGSAAGVDVRRRVEREGFGAGAGDVLDIVLDGPDDAPRRLMLVGLGRATAAEARRAGAAAARRCVKRTSVSTTVPAGASAVAAYLEGWLLATYRFSLRSAEIPPESATVELDVQPKDRAAVRAVVDRARAVAVAVHRARDLANTPSNLKSPESIVATAHELGDSAGLRVDVIAGDALVERGFGGLVAVGAGSSRPPALVVLEHAGAKRAPHVVLVGKGITFDSGGLSLKPADAMTLMKTDMAGAAAVLGAMSALRSLRVPTRVTALLALAENMPSGSSYRPGDVIEHFGGRTSEVVNTDAEGRLVLADALAYADAELDPDVVIDIATLTGAASVGLGRVHAAVFSPDDRLRRDLVAAGDAAGDPAWPMPLVEEYRDWLASPIADARHVEGTKVGGGAITAALFLQPFAGDRRWAHLDIAGPGRSDGDRHEVTRGATGYGTRLLLEWLSTLG
jgi:leucyl aminopeptidase